MSSLGVCRNFRLLLLDSRMSLPIKSKSFSMLQEKRRKLQLDLAKQRRDQLISWSYTRIVINRKKREQLLWESLSAGQKGSFPQVQQKDKRKEEAVRDQNRRRQFCQTLCIPEWMVEVPNDLATNWIVMPRPEGHRYLVSCKRGKASIRSLSGYTKNIKTNLPGGQYASLSQSVKNRMNFAGNCILDVIIADTCVYAMDILVFNSTEYAESEAESRLFTLHSRVFDHCRMRSSSPKNHIISSSTKNSFLSSYLSPFIAHFPPERSLFRVLRRESPFSPCQHSQCSPQRTSFLRVLPFFMFSLTSSRFGKMEEGCTPLQLLWKDAQTATYVINTDAQGTILASQSVTVSKPALNERSYSTKTVLFARWKDLSSSRASWLRLTTIRFFAALWEAFARIQSDSNGN